MLARMLRNFLLKTSAIPENKYLNLWTLLPYDGINRVLACVINGVLSIKEIVLVVDVALLKPIVTQTLDELIMIIRIKVQNYHNTFKTRSNTVYYFKCSKEC